MIEDEIEMLQAQIKMMQKDCDRLIKIRDCEHDLTVETSMFHMVSTVTCTKCGFSEEQL
jgi:hypothetical protein